MWTYTPPLRDIEYVIREWLEADQDWAKIPAFSGLDMPTAQQVLAEGGRFAAEVLAPLNASGDLEGCHYHEGVVTTPKGFPQAYKEYVDAGWPSLACSPESGGQGLPQLLNAALFEMMCAANHAFTMYPGLAHGAYECVRTSGSAALKDAYLPRIVSGESLVTMCLTEAHAGSDVGLLRTRAEPDPSSQAADGRYRISGTKIFISGGAHDLTSEIVHLVLARLPDAPAGTRGISLFLVPSAVTEAGVARPNSIRCDGIEKKMGIKGSATCVITFDGAAGWLIGEPNRGLAAMFVMMNSARLHVALQGLAHTEAACQNATQYANERLQMRAVSPGGVAQSAGRPKTGADLIIQHPPIRRALLELRAFTQGERALGYWIAHLIDHAEQHPDAGLRAHCHQLASLLTPLAKAFFTENGFELASRALQVFGGYGYVHDYAIEQTLRDSRIPLIYEGTNEIQAVDLFVRKVLGDEGRALQALLKAVRDEAVACDGVVGCREFADLLRANVSALAEAVAEVVKHSAADPELPYRVAGDFVRALGLLMVGFAWAKSARLAKPRVQSDAFSRDKWVTAQFFFDYLLPGVGHHLTLMGVARKGLAYL
ncbi:MAG: acyl-CoA dehydrogenase family protein [Gammaproteobacteria bacterium]